MADISQALTGVMDAHKKEHKKSKKEDKNSGSGSKSEKSRVTRPSFELDPDNEKLRVTVSKLCAYVEYLCAEVHEMRSELDGKSEFTDTNTLSIKLDDIAGKVDYLERSIDC